MAISVKLSYSFLSNYFKSNGECEMFQEPNYTLFHLILFFYRIMDSWVTSSSKCIIAHKSQRLTEWFFPFHQKNPNWTNLLWNQRNYTQKQTNTMTNFNFLLFVCTCVFLVVYLKIHKMQSTEPERHFCKPIVIALCIRNQQLCVCLLLAFPLISSKLLSFRVMFFSSLASMLKR